MRLQNQYRLNLNGKARGELKNISVEVLSLTTKNYVANNINKSVSINEEKSNYDVNGKDDNNCNDTNRKNNYYLVVAKCLLERNILF